ncbi:uncharacterized protein LOC107371245 [Tetranychus urticae]|uniref:BACK domain-containing protein n=1 Tax=Tetranychus urticae TaxID=32264 RepID=T1JYB1_TETUR|nr:uncharacterized protein LOC107371245 [Tetranychus urticae]
MASFELDDQLTIVNRSTEHRISKKLIRKVPYFEKLLNHECLESKENAVVLDFDEQAFKLFLNWIEFDHVLIEMKNVINLCTIIDYFGMDTKLINDCATYFSDNFSIKHLPVVIPQVTYTSYCINSGALNAFICRHFLKIANTTVWLKYPIEIIECICHKDLMIHSEVQVCNAIMKWIHFKRNSRKGYLERLLKLVRWCHLDDKDSVEIKGNDFIRFSFLKDVFSPLDQRDGVCINRTSQYYFVLVETLDGTDLQIKVFDRNFLPFIKRVIKLDESLPLHLFHNETVSDIAIDSARKMIRVDWDQNKYRWIDSKEFKSHCKIQEYMLEKSEEKETSLATRSMCASKYTSGASLLEFNDKCVLLTEDIISCTPSPFLPGTRSPILSNWFEYKLNLRCWTAPTDGQIARFNSSERNVLTTILDNKIYIMTSSRALIQFNIDSQEMKTFERKGTSNLGDLILTSKPSHDDKVLLIDRSNNVVECFNVKDEEWTPFGLLANICTSTGDQRKSNMLLTFTSAFLPINIILSCTCD